MNKRIRTNKIILLSSIPLSVLLLFTSLNFKRSPLYIENVLKSITTFSSQSQNNEEESYLIQKNINDSLEKEIQELKEVLELNKTLTEYSPVNAVVTSRNKSYWFNTINIDKGKKSGIKKNMAVITKQGLIGKITKVYTNSSEVKLITADDINYKVSVSIRSNNRDIYATLNGYDQENNLLKVIWVDKTETLTEDSVVVTSGIGELFPEGIFVGTIKKIESDKYNLSKTLYIKTNQDFNNIHYVTVLKEKEKWYQYS